MRDGDVVELPGAAAAVEVLRPGEHEGRDAREVLIAVHVEVGELVRGLVGRRRLRRPALPELAVAVEGTAECEHLGVAVAVHVARQPGPAVESRRRHDVVRLPDAAVAVDVLAPEEGAEELDRAEDVEIAVAVHVRAAMVAARGVGAQGEAPPPGFRNQREAEPYPMPGATNASRSPSPSMSCRLDPAAVRRRHRADDALHERRARRHVLEPEDAEAAAAVAGADVRSHVEVAVAVDVSDAQLRVAQRHGREGVGGPAAGAAQVLGARA